MSFVSIHQRNVRLGLASTTLYSQANFTGLEGLIFSLLISNSITFGLAGSALLISSLSAIATTAAVVGLQFLLMPKPPKPEDGKVPMTQAIPHRVFGVGTNRIAGAYMLWEAVNGVLYSVQALCGHPIDGISVYYLHDDIITIGVDGIVEDGPNERYGNNKIWIGTRLGASPETAYTELVAPLSAQGIWTASHRGDGQASLAMRCLSAGQKNFPKYYPQGHPRASVVADMAKLYDPRDPAQDPDDDTTWVFSKNSALAVLWQLCFNPFGPRQDYQKTILPVIDIWKEEADICDEDIARQGGGTEKRYECNGWATTETDPIAIMNAMLATCDGWLCRRGDGTVILRVGKFREELVETITDADIVGRMIQYDVPEEEAVNRLVPKFTYPATDYSTTDTDFFEDVSEQLKVGRILSTDADFGWVQQWRQARRLGKREWLRIQEKIRGTLDVRLSGFNAVYSRWIRLDTPVSMPALNGKLIENRRSIMSLMRGGFQMDFVKHPEDIDSWNPAVDEGSAPPIPPKPEIEDAPTPTIDSVQALSMAGGVSIRVTIIEPGRDDLTPVTSWRLQDDGSGEPGSWQDIEHEEWVAVGGLVALDMGPVIADETLDVRAAFRAPNGVLGPWSANEEVVSTLDPTPPVALTGFSVTGGSKHLGHAPLSISTAADDHLSRIAIYRVPTGVALDRETHLVTRLYGAQAASTFGYVNGDNTRANLLANPGFDSGASWSAGGGWVIGSGVADHTPGAASLLTQNVSMTAGSDYRMAVDVTSYAAGTFLFRLGGSPLVNSGNFTGNGTKLATLECPPSPVSFNVRADATFDAAVDNAVLYLETPACAPQGAWDYYAIPENASGVEGPTSGPLAVTII